MIAINKATASLVSSTLDPNEQEGDYGDWQVRLNSRTVMRNNSIGDFYFPFLVPQDPTISS